MGAILVLIASSGCSDQSPPVLDEHLGDQVADFAGSWDGYVELDQFDDGSDRVRLTLDMAGQGTLRLGERALFPPVSGPDAPYPDSSNPDPGSWRAGFAYPVSRVRVGAGRIRFSVDPHDLYRDWCRLQTPVLINANANPSGPPSPIYACAHDWPVSGDGVTSCRQTDPVTHQVIDVDCAKLSRCTTYSCWSPPPAPDGVGPGPCPPPPGMSCACTATACDFLPPPDDESPSLDAMIEGSGHKLTGTISPGHSTVRLARP